MLNPKSSRKPMLSGDARRDNPLRDLISDDVYARLVEHNLIDEKSLRDYHIRKLFKDLRSDKSASDAIESIQEAYPYLQFDTIRKIVYHIGSRAS